MTYQRDLFGARSSPPPEAVRARFDVDCTPSPVAAQIVDHVTRGWLRPPCREPGKEHEGDAPRVLDLCAGSGSWARAVRQRFPRAHITALEVRADERPYLEHWANEVVIGDVAALVVQTLQVRLRDADTELEAERLRGHLRMLLVEPVPAAEGEPVSLGGYDLIVGNPPFSMVDTRKPPKKGQPGKSRLRAYEVLVVAMRELLVADLSRLVLYVPAAWWQRGEGISDLAKDHEPFRQLNIPLPVSHRGRGQQASSDAYAAFVWGRYGVAKAAGWRTCDLPRLPSEDRRWSVMPGTER
jgi:hypothetical protein